MKNENEQFTFHLSDDDSQEETLSVEQPSSPSPSPSDTFTFTLSEEDYQEEEDFLPADQFPQITFDEVDDRLSVSPQPEEKAQPSPAFVRESPGWDTRNTVNMQDIAFPELAEENEESAEELPLDAPTPSRSMPLEEDDEPMPEMVEESARQEAIRQQRARRQQAEAQRKKRNRRRLLLLAGAVLLAILLLFFLFRLITRLSHGKTKNIGPLPAEEVSVHKVPVYYDYAAPVPASAAADDNYFSNAIMIGDTRVQCLDLYDVGSFQTLLYGTAINSTNAMEYECASSDGTDSTPNGKLSMFRYGKVYLNLGINELGWPNEQTFVEGYRALVKDVKGLQPDATIYVLSIMPVSQNRDSRGDYISNERIRQYNALLQGMCAEDGVYYVDCYSGIADEGGFLPSDLTSDGVNLLKSGCDVWYDYLKTHTVNAEDYAN